MDLRWDKGTASVRKGQDSWFRVVSLNEEISHDLLEFWLPYLPDKITIGRYTWEVVSTHLNREEHPWAGQTSCTDLIIRAAERSNAEQQRWKLEFVTPTAFSGKTGDLPFPMPSSLARSWLERWQANTPSPQREAVSEGLPEIVHECVAVSSYKMNTDVFQEGRQTNVGGVGWMTLTNRGLSPEYAQAFDALAQYSFYCSSGHRTTQGMGMTRLTY